MRSRWLLLLFVLMLGAMPLRAEERERLGLVAGVPPIGWLAEQIGGERVDVQVLVDAGQDPHLFEVSPKQAAALHKAQVFLSAGLPFEKRIAEKMAGREGGLIVVDLSSPLSVGGCEDDEHDHGEHAHGCEDSHTWLSPLHLKVMARELAESLKRRDPKHADGYAARLKKLLAECDRVHDKLTHLLEDRPGGTFYVFHPAFGHFAQCYGLQQKAVEKDGKQPGPRHMAELIREARADRVSLLFVQPQFDQRSMATMARAIGATVQQVDPLKADVLGNLESLGKAIRAALPEMPGAEKGHHEHHE